MVKSTNTIMIMRTVGIIIDNIKLFPFYLKDNAEENPWEIQFDPHPLFQSDVHVAFVCVCLLQVPSHPLTPEPQRPQDG